MKKIFKITTCIIGGSVMLLIAISFLNQMIVNNRPYTSRPLNFERE